MDMHWSNNGIKFPNNLFLGMIFVLFPLEIESPHYSKLSPEIHGNSILMERFHTRNHKSWDVVVRRNLGNHLIQTSLILWARKLRPREIQHLPKIILVRSTEN